jgi:hypothetical protein
MNRKPSQRGLAFIKNNLEVTKTLFKFVSN